ncbi:TIGR01777 family oxidoreductase [Pseudarthrobacter sp. J1738]|uniref:TIGR01777 family oxidoreductase n=1 Tax=Pseudarthrobacter sp. J1738 TaxID=3420446 RepID=UPI003D2E3676
MGITHSSTVPAPIDEVFAWHSRPGAFTRLAAPWQPVRVLEESTSLRDGQAVMALPGGVRLLAKHNPKGYEPPLKFMDEIGGAGFASLKVGAAFPWHHSHEFAALNDATTQMTDRVETPASAHFLRPMFIYRHRQLAEDLAVHARAAAAGVKPLTVAMTGASGTVGTALAAFLSTGGHTVVRLVRHRPKNSQERLWDPMNPAPGLLDGVDAVVHLAGESISGRFTTAHKNAIRDSRITPTRLLAEAAAAASAAGGFGPKTMVVASAIGYYGPDRGEEELTEDSSRGEGFLAEVVSDWEAATHPASEAGLRVVQVRTGIVQSTRGGVLKLMRPLFEAGVGGRVGSGRQWFAWIDLEDLIDTYHRALTDPAFSGPVNAVAPHVLRNGDYATTLGKVLHRPAVVAVPGFGPRLLLGNEGALELAEASQKVLPAKLLAAGHSFRRPELEASLRHQLGRF